MKAQFQADSLERWHLSPVADKKKKQKVKPWYAATSLIHVDSPSFSSYLIVLINIIFFPSLISLMLININQYSSSTSFFRIFSIIGY